MTSLRQVVEAQLHSLRGENKGVYIANMTFTLDILTFHADIWAVYNKQIASLATFRE